jgi:hypothetical protein
MDHELIWFQPDEEIVEMDRHMIQSEQVILMIVWTLNDFHIINALPKGVKFNANHCVTQILDPLSD